MSLFNSEKSKYYKCSEELNIFEQTHYNKARQFAEYVGEDYDKEVISLKEGIATHHGDFMKSIDQISDLARTNRTTGSTNILDKHIGMIKTLTVQRMHEIVDLAKKDHDNDPNPVTNEEPKKNKSWKRA